MPESSPTVPRDATVSPSPTGPERRSSIPSGDLVLANLPPYLEKMWLIVGLPYLAGILRDEAGIRARIPNVYDDALRLPAELADSGLESHLFDLTPDERRARLMGVIRGYDAVIEHLLDTLTSGGENVFGFSTFMMNAEFTIEVTRRLKERRPSCLVMVGGPEAIQDPERFHVPSIDAVVGMNAETIIVPIARALLDGHPERARNLPAVWINPQWLSGRSSASADDPALVPSCSVPTRPLMDYAEIAPLALLDPQPFLPVLINIGCRNVCAFCVNRAVYPEFLPGSTERSIAELMQVLDLVDAAGAASRANVMFCDSTVNEYPEQLEAVCDAVVQRGAAVPTGLLGNLVFGPRLTERTVRKMLAAGFQMFYFGLESASPAVRRSMHKPASIRDIAAAMGMVQRLRPRSMGVSVIAGWPTETEEDFAATLTFLERAGAAGMLDEVIAHIPVLVPGMNDRSPFEPNRGARRGILWQNDAPAGDPEVRRRRLLTLVERVSRYTVVGVPFTTSSRMREFLYDGRR
jgi:hypothetical protein